MTTKVTITNDSTDLVDVIVDGEVRPAVGAGADASPRRKFFIPANSLCRIELLTRSEGARIAIETDGLWIVSIRINGEDMGTNGPGAAPGSFIGRSFAIAPDRTFRVELAERPATDDEIAAATA